MGNKKSTPPTTSTSGPGWHFPPSHEPTMEDPLRNAPAPGYSAYQEWSAVAPKEHQHHPGSAAGWQPVAPNASTPGDFAANSASSHWGHFQEPPPAAPYGYVPAPSPDSATNPGWMSSPPAAPAVSSMESHSAPAPASPSAAAWTDGEQTEDEDQWDQGSVMSVENDYDSAIGMSISGGSITGSITESIYQYREEYNRTYHAFKADESAYFLPNDHDEQERMNFQHYIFLMSQNDRLYLCPAGRNRPLERVLDAGTGTGIWAMQFAEMHTNTAVVGVDLSPIQPPYVPINVDFFVDDLEEDWQFEASFDFIYARMLTGSIRDWPRFMRQALENLTPGGWLELADLTMPLACDDGTFYEGCALRTWNELLVDSCEKAGAGLGSAVHYKQQMLDAGFQDVTEVEYKWPVGTWPSDPKDKEIGYMMLYNTWHVLEASSLLPFSKVLGWQMQDIHNLCAAARQDLNNRGIHCYFPMRVVYGRKPV